MGNERKKLRFEVFIDRYFSNFGRILLTNILFAIPSFAFIGLFYLLSDWLFHGFSTIFMMLSIIPLYPFYAGVVKVSRNLARGDSDVPVCSTYFAALKDNFLLFLLHGAVVAAAVIFSYASISFYISLISVSWVMIAVLVVSILIALLALYASFYLPLMSVTYDIKPLYLYKNSFLMAFGEFKNNLFATLALLIVSAIFMTMTAFSPSVTVLLIIIGALWSLLVPATVTFSYIFFIYDGMVNMIRSKDHSHPDADEPADTATPAEKLRASIEEDDFSDIDVSKLRDTDDFIFHNGRMVKQSTLLRLVKERQQREEEDQDE